MPEPVLVGYQVDQDNGTIKIFQTANGVEQVCIEIKVLPETAKHLYAGSFFRFASILAESLRDEMETAGVWHPLCDECDGEKTYEVDGIEEIYRCPKCGGTGLEPPKAPSDQQTSTEDTQCNKT